MTENAKINGVLRALFALPISAEQRLGAFFLWGMLLPVDPRAEKKAGVRAHRRTWVAANPEKVKVAARAWKEKNPEKARAGEKTRDAANRRVWMREYERRRLREDTEFRLKKLLRSRINMALKSATKADKTIRLLNMSVAEYRIYLQGQFLSGMTWDNWGDVWEIDHIRPCASFDLSEPAQQRECFHWSNTQPLFEKENGQKGAKYVSVG